MTPANISRRRFIEASLAAGMASPLAASAESGATLSSQIKFSTNALGKSITDGPLGVALPENAPPLIADKAVYATSEFDVVVIGCGLSGLCAALSAAERGARVVILEKGFTYGARGGENGAIDSKFQLAAGVTMDKSAVANQIMISGAFRANQRVVNLWVENSGHCLDWVIDIAVQHKLEPFIPLPKQVMQGGMPFFPTSVQFVGGNVPLVSALEQTARAKGIPILYQTPAVQLLRKNQQRVTGVIARDNQNRYLKFNAKQAVIMCSGGYENSREMMQKYLRPDQYLGARIWLQPTPTTTGDGLRIASWIGAAPQSTPHCLMSGSGALPDGQVFSLAIYPWLHVNIHGERFMQEQLPSDYIANAINAQPTRSAWVIWDADWPKVISVPSRLVGYPKQAAADAAKRLEVLLQHGLVVKADTLEELAVKINVPKEKFLATTARYNELAKLGRDADYGKSTEWMHPLSNAPFYAANSGMRALVTVCGLSINEQLQVLDTSRNIIPGLYAAGNASGDFFVGTYAREVSGASHGRALTFGRLAGQHAVNENA